MSPTISPPETLPAVMSEKEHETLRSCLPGSVFIKVLRFCPAPGLDGCLTLVTGNHVGGGFRNPVYAIVLYVHGYPVVTPWITDDTLRALGLVRTPSEVFDQFSDELKSRIATLSDILAASANSRTYAETGPVETSHRSPAPDGSSPERPSDSAS